MSSPYSFGPLESGNIKYTESVNRSFKPSFGLEEGVNIPEDLYRHLSCDFTFRALLYEKVYKRMDVKLCWTMLEKKRKSLNDSSETFDLEQHRRELLKLINESDDMDHRRISYSYIIPLLFPDPESSALACSDNYIINMVRYAGAWVDMGRQFERQWQIKRIKHWLKMFKPDTTYDLSTDDMFPIDSQLFTDKDNSIEIYEKRYHQVIDREAEKKNYLC